MKYSYLNKQKEGIDMQTTYYTFTANEIIVTGAGVEQASGGSGRRMVYLRHSKPLPETSENGKLIDFTAWCADHEAELCMNGDEREEEACFEAEESVCDERTERGARIGMYLDWIASAALAAVALSACVGFLF